MTSPVQPYATPQPPPITKSNPEQSKLKEGVDKIFDATRGLQQSGLTKAPGIKPSTAEATITPNPQKAIVAVAQASKKSLDLIALMEIPSQIRGGILTRLSDNELSALEIALGKRVLTPAFRDFHKEITKIKQDRILQEILADHPSWKSQVEAWKGVSLEDKIWLLQLYELRNLGIYIPQIAKQEGMECVPSEPTLDLLKPDTKTAISTSLDKILEVNWSCRQLKKCPRAICLLSNLQNLYLRDNPLTTPPDVSKNVSLKHLELTLCQLTAPPDVSKNINLQRLTLLNNQLTVSPDVSKNVGLKSLELGYNQLTASPDVSKNINLQDLTLRNNQLTTPPDVSKNVKLERLYLDNNQLTAPPDVSKNVSLKHLELSNSQLTDSPDVSKNVNLQFFEISHNNLTVLPDVSKNVVLIQLSIYNNPLTLAAKQELGKLRKERHLFSSDNFNIEGEL